MRRSVLAAMALAIALLVCALPASAAATGSKVRIGTPPAHPQRSRVIGALAPATPILVTVTLKPRDPAGLASYAAAVSTPGSDLYHRYLTVAGFRARFGPTEQQIDAVDQALRSEGLRPGAVSANGLAVPLSASAGTVGHAFALSFQRVALANGRHAYANTAAPALPASIAGTVQSVLGLSTLAEPQPLSVRAASHTGRAASHTATESSPASSLKPNVITGGAQPCSAASTGAAAQGDFTADQLASAYQFSSLYAAGDQGSGQTIALYELEPNTPSDITAYESCYGISSSVTYQKVDGGAGTGPGQGEAALDIEDVVGLAPKAKVIVYQGPNGGAGIFDTYNHIVSDNKAKVISTSWGLCEPDQGSAEISAESTLFQEAATQGQTVFAASGDLGSEACHSSNALAVSDPASQPYVTGVGGTTLSALGPPPSETVWNGNGGASGGGISTAWSMPPFQSGASSSLRVINSNSSGAPCGAGSGSYCREVPDVSADADPGTGYEIYYDGGWAGIGGTSAAAPLWAAFMALVNSDSSCSAPIGFANPVLYDAAGHAYSNDFSDVTSGNNDLTGTHAGKYPAAAGYDMATGLGSPNGSYLPATLCSGGVPGPVLVINPGSQTGLVGQAHVPLQITATDSTSGATIQSYAASGLPAGMSIDTATGEITGTPNAAGSQGVTVTATDSNGASSSASFMWTVSSRTTSTALSCSPASLNTGSSTLCTATVTDTDSSGAKSAPTGTVSVSSDGSGSFVGGNSCTLTAVNSSQASCPVTYSPVSFGSQHLTASYRGDAAHSASAGGTVLSVIGPPVPEILSPANNQTFARGASVQTTFLCLDGSEGPGISSCTDSHGVSGTSGTLHGTLDTGTVGSHSYSVTAVSQDGQSAASTIIYQVVDTPTNTARPTIRGTAAAHRTLSCSPGSWTESPTAFVYQWSRYGTPIAGATASSYAVKSLDEGSALGCTVTAVNVAGRSAPASSATVTVALPKVAGCPRATGKLSATTLGLVKLGETRKRAEHAYRHSSNRGTSYQDFFCLTPIGVRVGYASPKLLASLAATARKHFKRRVIWISTANPFYALDGIRPGATLTAAGSVLKLSKVFHVGRNSWYLAPAGRATAVLKVRGGIVQEIGIGTKQLTQTRASERTFLTSFS